MISTIVSIVIDGSFFIIEKTFSCMWNFAYPYEDPNVRIRKDLALILMQNKQLRYEIERIKYGLEKRNIINDDDFIDEYVIVGETS